MPKLPKYFNDPLSGSYGTSGSIQSDQEVSYISMVKRIGVPWKIELNESRHLQEHLNYIERVRPDPGVEEVKVTNHSSKEREGQCRGSQMIQQTSKIGYDHEKHSHSRNHCTLVERNCNQVKKLYDHLRMLALQPAK